MKLVVPETIQGGKLGQILLQLTIALGDFRFDRAKLKISDGVKNMGGAVSNGNWSEVVDLSIGGKSLKTTITGNTQSGTSAREFELDIDQRGRQRDSKRDLYTDCSRLRNL